MWSPAAVTSVSLAGTGAGESLVNNGTGPNLVTKDLVAGSGITLSGGPTSITITNTVSTTPIFEPNYAPTYTIYANEFATLPYALDGSTYATSLLAPNGMLYIFVSVNGSPTGLILRVDIQTNTVTALPPVAYFATLGVTPAIYSPYNNNFYIPMDGGFARFNWQTETLTFNVISFPGPAPIFPRFRGIARGRTGKYYLCPAPGWPFVGILDLATETLDTTTIADPALDPALGNDAWWGGVQGHNGKIYFAPAAASNFLEVDPETNTWRLFGALAGGTTIKTFGVVMAPNGNAYFIPGTATQQVRLINTNLPTPGFSAIGGTFAGTSFRGGFWHPDGMIYSGLDVLLSGSVLQINPATNTVSLAPFTVDGTIQNFYPYGDMVPAPDGAVYVTPTRQSNRVYVMRGGYPLYPLNHFLAPNNIASGTT